MIIDFHTHLFPKDIRENRSLYFENEPAFELLYKSEKSKMIDADELVRTMDEQKVDRSVVFGFPWKNSVTVQNHNNYIIESIERFPDRLVGFCCFGIENEHPLEEVKRCINNGLKGVGELAFYIDAIGEKTLTHLQPVMDFCRESDLPVLLHANEPVGHQYPGKAPESLSGVYQIISRFPENTIVLAHWGGGLFFYTLMKKQVKQVLQNVYFDTAASPFLYDTGVYSIACKLVGSEKILFGSDFPLIKPSRYFSELEQTDLSETDKEKILGSNAKALLKI